MLQLLSYLWILLIMPNAIQAGETLISSITGSSKAYTGRLCTFRTSQYFSLVPKNVYTKLKLSPTDTINIVFERPQGLALLRPHVGMVVPDIYRKAHQARVKAKLPGLPASVEDPDVTVKVFSSQGQRLVDKKYNIVAEIDERTGTENEHLFCSFKTSTPKISAIKTSQASYTDSFWSVVENRGKKSVTYHVIPTQSDFDFWINQVPHFVTTDLSTTNGGKKRNNDISRALGIFFKRLESQRKNLNSQKSYPVYCEHLIALLGGDLHPSVKEKYKLSTASFESLKRLPYFAAGQVLPKIPSKDAKALLKTHKIVENRTKKKSTKVKLPNGMIVAIKGKGAMVHRNLVTAPGLKGRVIKVDDTTQSGQSKKKK